jgi:hypothetical protein
MKIKAENIILPAIIDEDLVKAEKLLLKLFMSTHALDGIVLPNGKVVIVEQHVVRAKAMIEIGWPELWILNRGLSQLLNPQQLATSPMTVGHLIDQLQKFPPDKTLVISAENYEYGDRYAMERLAIRDNEHFLELYAS